MKTWLVWGDSYPCSDLLRNSPALDLRTYKSSDPYVADILECLAEAGDLWIREVETTELAINEAFQYDMGLIGKLELKR